jgi:hypothetical protein
VRASSWKVGPCVAGTAPRSTAEAAHGALCPVPSAPAGFAVADRARFSARTRLLSPSAGPDPQIDRPGGRGSVRGRDAAVPICLISGRRADDDPFASRSTRMGGSVPGRPPPPQRSIATAVVYGSSWYACSTADVAGQEASVDGQEPGPGTSPSGMAAPGSSSSRSQPRRPAPRSAGCRQHPALP